MIPGVPYDEELEYIESTGTQWIDTGVKPSEDLATYITFSYQQIANNVSAFGSRSNSTVNDRYWLNYDGKFEIGYGNWGSAVETTSVGAINTIAFNEIVDRQHNSIWSSCRKRGPDSFQDATVLNEHAAQWRTSPRLHPRPRGHNCADVRQGHKNVPCALRNVRCRSRCSPPRDGSALLPEGIHIYNIAKWRFNLT